MAGFFLSALITTLVGQRDFYPSIALFVPLAVLLGMCIDDCVFHELSSFVLPDSLDQMVLDRGVLSGAEPEGRVRALGCPATASLQKILQSSIKLTAQPFEVQLWRSEALSIDKSLPPFHLQAHCCKQA